jgi:adenylate cyclase
MTEIILNNNGTVSLLIGDGIFAFFGAPVRLDNCVAAAVRSALQMKEKVAELTPGWRKYGMDDMRIGIGIHFGEAIVGNIGSVKKMVYAAIGDNVNVASRIEGLTKEMQEIILLSVAAYEQAKDMVNAGPRGLAKIKGHSEVEVFALDRLKSEYAGR